MIFFLAMPLPRYIRHEQSLHASGKRKHNLQQASLSTIMIVICSSLSSISTSFIFSRADHQRSIPARFNIKKNSGQLPICSMKSRTQHLKSRSCCTPPVRVAECEGRTAPELECDDVWLEMERSSLVGKCRGSSSGGIAELLECLEKEAIMGEDEGKDPKDYNRRARIFDKSSSVFQALKGSARQDVDDDRQQS